MERRGFLSLLGRAALVGAAGLLVPEEPRRVYSFLRDNPLAVPKFKAFAMDLPPPRPFRLDAYLRGAGLVRIDYCGDGRVLVNGKPHRAGERLPGATPAQLPGVRAGDGVLTFVFPTPTEADQLRLAFV